MSGKVLPLCLVAVFSSLACCAQEPPQIVFGSYNLENFTDGTVAGDFSSRGTKAKSPKAIETQIRIISEISPDILGICEMGRPDAFERFKALLAGAGLNYPYSEYVKAEDKERHLAIVSRFPIVAKQSRTDVRFEFKGKEDTMRRGILDVTVQVTPEYALRCVGAHLKSKLPVPGGEALIRRFEAQKFRQHLDGIFQNQPGANVLCFGDFNETKDQPAFAAISGVRGTPEFLADLACVDSLGDRWTHYWQAADEYVRIDYLFASRGLLPEVLPKSASIYRSEDWNEASDHRPIFVSIIPIERDKPMR